MQEIDKQAQIARDSMERYSDSDIGEFCPYMLLTNFPRYVDYFAKSRGVPVKEGSTFKVAHSPKEGISILDYKMGSPMAALVVDLCAFLPFKALLMLGMCGGLRERFRIGDYFVPVGSIRGDGTSDFYFPPEVPALGNFMVQKMVTEVLDEQGAPYHLGITHTTNKRFWEFNDEFKNRLNANRAHCVEMECSTLFMSSYKHKLALGALLLISDLPLLPGGIKTKQSAMEVFEKYTGDHVEKGATILARVRQWQERTGAKT
jgi:AMP nucleosidase